MAQGTTRTVVVEGKSIVYCLERKNVKNINLRVRRDGSISASAAGCVSDERVDDFVREQAGFVFRALDTFASQEVLRPKPGQLVSGETVWIQGKEIPLEVCDIPAARGCVVYDGERLRLSARHPENLEEKRRLLSKFWDEECRRVFEEILGEVYPRIEPYGVKFPGLKLRRMTSRWGSCLTWKGVILLNKHLLHAPRCCIEYVAMHELCHFIHPNHSKRFYRLLEELMPDWERRKKLLDTGTAYWLG